MLICTVALLVSALTLFSGFGLGTLLMPAFAIFFPVEVAIAATAVVHLANNLFKLGLVAKHAHWKTVLLFGVPAAAMALLGAWLLEVVGKLPPLVQYPFWGGTHSITPVKLVLAFLMIGFAVLELSPRFEKLAFDARYIPLGGVLSGFFGGLSGHQGALRAAFLVRAGLTKEQFIGTTNVCAVIVDVSRLPVYVVAFLSDYFPKLESGGGVGLVIAGSLAAFAGSFAGTRLVKKVTLRGLQLVVGVMLLVVAVVIGAGLIPD